MVRSVVYGLLSVATLLWGSGESRAANAGSAGRTRIERVEIGLGGNWKVGYWTPVQVAIRAGKDGFSGFVRVQSPDNDGVPTQYQASTLEKLKLTPGATWRGWRYFQAGRINAHVRIALVQTGGTVVDTRTVRDRPAAPSNRQWVVGVGQDIGLGEAARLLLRWQGERTLVSQLDNVEQFPDCWQGYEGVNILLVCTATTNVLADLSPRQWAALQRWVELGGRMILSASRQAADMFGESGQFKQLRPGHFVEMDPYWRASSLERLAGTPSRLVNPTDVPLAVFDRIRGRVLSYEGAGDDSTDRPLITEYPFGFGEILFLAFDLDRPPISTWTARPRLLAKLLVLHQDQRDSAAEAGGLGRVSHVGFDDIIGQLHGALEQFRGVTVVRFSWVAGILIVYILLIGPADYFGLRKLRHPHWTWVTFPVIVLAFSMLALLLAHRWKGRSLQVNKVDIVDVDAERSLMRGTTWISVYSPQAAAMNIDLKPTPPIPTTETPNLLLSWRGLPGRGLGGMDTTMTVGTSDNTYTVRNVSSPDDQPQVLGIPVHASSTKGLNARWWAQATRISVLPLKVDSGGYLIGSVVNPLRIKLKHCRVYYRNWAYQVDNPLQPGESVDLETISPLDLRWQLTRRHVVQADDVSVPWNRANFSNIPRILEMLMFHDAAGGEKYTQLRHRYQAYTDFTQHIRMGRAVLVGRNDTGASELTEDGRPIGGESVKTWTFYRIVIPITSDSAH